LHPRPDRVILGDFFQSSPVYDLQNSSVLADLVGLKDCNDCSIGVVDVWDGKKALVEQNSRCSRLPDRNLPARPQKDNHPPRNRLDIAGENEDYCRRTSIRDLGPPSWYG